MGWPRGSHHSMETKAKMREAHLGKHLSDEHKAKISKAELGKHLSEETKAKMREAHLGKHLSEETKIKMSIAQTGENNPMFGKHRSEETKSKISKSELGKHLSIETKQKLREARLGKHLSEETKAKISKANLGKHPSEETKAKISKANLGKHHSDETKSKMSKAQKKLWQDPQFAKRSFEAFNKTLNKPEKMLMEILDSNFQGEWKFVGDGQFFLAGLCPDFISINGKKKIIEMFGTYWHRDKENIKYYQTEYGRKKIFGRYGYDLLVIWEDELQDKDMVLDKIERFMGVR